MSVPTAVYDWFIGKSEAIITGGRIVIDQVGDLHFISVEMGDELAGEKTYNCSLYNVVAQLRVYGSPTKFKVNPVTPAPRDPAVVWFTDRESSVALLGKTLTLQCIPDGYPLPKIEWARTGGSLPVGRHIISDDKYTLEISNVTEADEGTYTCTAVHGSQRSVQNIFVDVKSEPIWVEKLKSMIVTTGKTVEFKCVARSAVGEQDNPLVQWFQNGKPLSAGITGKIEVSGTKLTVSGVSKPYDLMNIQCNVSNSIGYQLADAFLNVIDQTKLDVRPEPKYLIDPGKVLEVHIMAVADPLYHRLLTYRWSTVKDGQAVSKNPADPVYVDVSNTLIINATRLDRDQAFLDILGNYSCLVSMGLEKGEGDVVVYTHISSDEEEAIIAEAAMELWWIAIVIAVIVLILIIILICCLLYRNRGGTYPVDEKERRAGHDPEKELADSGFQDLSRADAPDEKKPYGNPDQVSLTNDPPLGGDTDSLDEYGEPDSSKFNEDGSFIGNYGGRKGRDMNQSTV
ncbi:neural cell adhesion molecule L1-like [Liolophura sinensis]|uniref:neural cell adhesion molecule L1-like n=1 Tax=Liolophura sinensis TaxID=3198878 RepID=UPI00315815A0